MVKVDWRFFNSLELKLQALINKLKKNHLIERLEKTRKIVYSEKKGLKSSENDKIVEEFFQETKNNREVLLGVLGGRNSEGKDFSGDKMSCVIIAGSKSNLQKFSQFWN